jgi:hypothetical protein
MQPLEMRLAIGRGPLMAASAILLSLIGAPAM